MGTLTKIISPDLTGDKFFDDLGHSYDSAFGRKRRLILTGKTLQEGAVSPGWNDILTYKFASNQKDFSKITSASMSGKASYGLFKGSGSGKLRKFFSSNSYSCYLFAHASIVDPKYVLREYNLEPLIEEFLKANSNDFDLIESEIGDEVIKGVTVGSEIMIKIEIQTKSETQKKSISGSTSGSYSTSFSASGSVGSVKNQIKESKRIVLTVMGDFPEKFLENTTVEAIDKLLLNFPKDHIKGSILQVETIDLRDINQMLEYPKKIINRDELIERQEFIIDLDNMREDILNWLDDIDYVLSDSNIAEFSSDSIKQAKLDSDICEAYLREIDVMYKKANAHWVDNGNNGDFFKHKQFEKFPKEFPIYARIEPKPVPPKKKPKRERIDHGGNMAASGGAGGRA
jgi:hypothetical protein